MKKSILFLAIAALYGVCAEPVTPEMAKVVANAWVARNAAFKAGLSAKTVRAEYDPENASVVLWYQVSMTGGGCLMVAPDTEIEPVVAALDNDPGVLPAAHPLRAILTGDLRKRLAFLAKAKQPSTGGASLQSAAPLPEDDASVVAREWGSQQKVKWAKLGIDTGIQLQEAETVGVKDPIAVEIGIVPGFEKGGALTHWNQSGAGGYNLYTPGSAVCGCVATATSALIQFFKAPKGPEDGYSKTCSYNGVRSKYTVKGGDYDWSILPTNWGGEAEESSTLDADQKDLIGRLAYDAGVCHGMMWTKGESGAFTTDTAHVLRDCFGFKEARLVKSPKQDQYRKLIYQQCWSGAPVGMGIESHAVVAVGYGKDAEGVDRVRVFMGWGGSGDGWYALPYIDTKATMNGGTYLSEVVDSITTMISLEDDCIVPVCGTLIPSMDAPVTITIGSTVVETNANKKGYFGTRLSAAAMIKDAEMQISCQEKNWTVTLTASDPGTATKGNNYAESAIGLCEWIPDANVYPLLNSESAPTMESAIAQALQDDPIKPILAFSGSWGEETTDLAWQIIKDLDDTDADFANRFVVLCLPYSPNDKTSDGNPSLALFDPQVTGTDDRWAAWNGRVRYWSAFHCQFSTNEQVKVEAYLADPETYTNDIAAANAVYTNAVAIYKQALKDGDEAVIESAYTVMTNRQAELDAINFNLYDPTNASANRYLFPEEITNGVYSVIYGAYDVFTNQLGIAKDLTLTAQAISADGESLTLASSTDFCFTTNNCFRPGQSVEVTAAESVTNASGTIAYTLKGWMVTTNSLEEALVDPSVRLRTGDTVEAVFNLEPGDETGTYNLYWIYDVSAVKVTIDTRWENNSSYENKNAGSVDVSSGWFASGETIEIVATANKGWRFETWRYDEWRYDEWRYDEAVLRNAPNFTADELGNTVSFTVGSSPSPVTISAMFAKDTSVANATLIISNVDTSGDPVAFCENVTTNLAPGWTTLSPSNTVMTAEDGSVWTCIGWIGSGDVTNGLNVVTGDTAQVTFEIKKNTKAATNTLDWVWQMMPPPPASFVIDWNTALDDLVVGYTTNLMTAAELEAAGISVDDIPVTVPLGWKVSLMNDGENVVATLALDEEALEASMETVTLDIRPNADGTLAVEAHVPAAIRGFWYSIYGADELTGSWAVVAEGAYDATLSETAPSVHAKQTDETGELDVKIVVDPIATRQFYKARVDVKEPKSK